MTFIIHLYMCLKSVSLTKGHATRLIMHCLTPRETLLRIQVRKTLVFDRKIADFCFYKVTLLRYNKLLIVKINQYVEMIDF